jgi:uncharacterized protein
MASQLKRRSRQGKSKAWAGYLFSFFLGVLFAVGGYLFLAHQKVLSPIPPSAKRSLSERPAPKPLPDSGIGRREARHREEEVAPSHKVAIVIDDLGGEKDRFQDLLDLKEPVTFSILPFTPLAQTTAQRAFQRGREVILHLPMEPHGYPRINPGKGVLLHSMGEEELLRQLARDIDAVPYVKGASNHMGSLLTEDSGRMKIILAELKRRGLFFLDSRTTPESVGFQVAKTLGMKTAEKTLFLDHLHEENHIREKIEELIQVSLTRGQAIGIGHPYPSTIHALHEMLPGLRERGIEVVPLSELME